MNQKPVVVVKVSNEFGLPLDSHSMRHYHDHVQSAFPSMKVLVIGPEVSLNFRTSYGTSLDNE
jgi:hypothetical protein